jgi:hypothetical protein
MLGPHERDDDWGQGEGDKKRKLTLARCGHAALA